MGSCLNYLLLEIDQHCHEMLRTSGDLGATCLHMSAEGLSLSAELRHWSRCVRLLRKVGSWSAMGKRSKGKKQNLKVVSHESISKGRPPVACKLHIVLYPIYKPDDVFVAYAV